MLKESLKWMILTLVIAAMLVTAVVCVPKIIHNSQKVGQEAQREPAQATPTPTLEPEQTSTPLPTLSPTPSPTPLPETADQWLERMIAERMTTEEKIGQMVLFGFSGTDQPSDAFAQLHQTYRVGNFILYGNNIKSGDSDGGFGRCAELINTLNLSAQTEIPPLIAIDVEGGEVVRFGWPEWPASARTLGRRGDTAAAREQFQNIGQKLKSTGIQMNLAPVLDVASNPSGTFLGTRIISDDAETVANIGAAVIEGLHDSGCLAVAKHFPGHGGTTRDSHDVTPVIEKTLDQMETYDLVPFARAVETGVDAILVAHILYPELDDTDIASMSSIIITNLLREHLGFSGIVISDDFRMGGLTTRYDTGDAAVRFILAGGDMIMCGAQKERQKAILEGLLTAAQDGTLTEERINESVFRILKKKLTVTGWQIDLS